MTARSDEVVVVVQARMGSSRLPGKVGLPLDGKHVLTRVVDRLKLCSEVDEIVVATSTEKKDDVISEFVDAPVYRGSEEDVLGRMFEASKKHEADHVVRITSDCPLILPEIVDKVVEKLIRENADYCSNTVDRTFPRGFDVEAFTFSSFQKVEENSDKPFLREHVTPLYRQSDDYQVENVSSEEVFESPNLFDRTDLRLTLDEAPDYVLLKKIFENISRQDLLNQKKVIDFIDSNDLSRINSSVKQKHSEGDSSD